MTRFSVPDMTCGHCKATIETALKGLDANAAIDVDLDKHTVAVETTKDAAAMIDAMKEAGYSPRVIA